MTTNAAVNRSRPCTAQEQWHTSRSIRNPQSKIQNGPGNVPWPCGLLTLAVLGALCVSAFAGPPGAAGDLYVASTYGDCVYQFDGHTGAYVGEFVTPGSGGLDGPSGLVFAPDGSLLVACGNRVLEYDGQTGAYLGEFVPAGSGGLEDARDATFGPNGNLFVANDGGSTGEVLEYEGATGAFARVFTSDSGLASPDYLAFGPGGDLFVSGSDVRRYDGQTGESLGIIGAASGLSNPYGLTFGPGGNLFVAAYLDRQVFEFDGLTGEFIDIFADGGGAYFYDVCFGPDGDLFVSTTDEWVGQFHGLTGQSQGVFASGGTRHWRHFTFKPFDNVLFPAPGLTDFQPTATDNCDLLPGVTITGSGLAWGAELWLAVPGEAPLPAANVSIVSDAQITADFDLANATPGLWDLELHYADGQSAVLANAMEVTACPEPVITGFEPASVHNCAPLIGALITGENFIPGSATSARLTRPGEDDIEATNVVVVDTTTITADFDLTAATIGWWDLELTYPDESTGVLVDAVEVTLCPPPVVIGLSPDTDDNCGWLRGATISGGDFYAGAVVRLTSLTSDDVVVIDNVEVVSATTIAVDFALSGVEPGAWNLTVNNPGDLVGTTLAAALEITACPLLEVTAIDLPRTDNCGALSGVTISGVGFASGATVTLRLNGDTETEIPGTGVSVTPAQITASFAVTGAEPGLWEVIVRNPGGPSAVLGDALRIAPCNPDPTSVRMDVVSAWGGQVNDVFVDEAVDPNIAYVAAGRRLVVLNVADPAHVAELGAIDLGHLVHDIVVRDGYAFVATHGMPNYFCVVDVSDPANLQVVWTSDNLSEAPRQVALRGQYAYVRWGYDLHAFDISDPTDVREIGRVASANVEAIAVEGDRLYVGWGSSPPELRVYDLAADPDNAPLLGAAKVAILPGARPWALDVQGDYACLVSREQGYSSVCVIDVSDPVAPVQVGCNPEVLANGAVKDVTLSGGYAYIADWTDTPRPWFWDETHGLAILDVATDPANPTLVSTFKPHGNVWGVRVYGDRAYLLDQGEGLIILDVSDPLDPVRLGGDTGRGAWHSLAGLRQIDKIGNHLFVTDAWNGFTILDVANPGQPTVAGVYQVPWSGTHMDHWGIKLRDELAYLSAGYDGVQIVDVADPGTPTLLGGYPFGSVSAMGIALRGDIAHVGLRTTGGGWLVNFDVSDPLDISDVGDVFIPGMVYALTVTPAGNAFLAHQDPLGGSDALTSLDTSAAVAPFTVNELFGKGVDVVRDRDLLYAASNDNVTPYGNGGLFIYDASNPAAPIELSHFDAHKSTAVGWQNEVVYLVTTYDGYERLLALDVSDPTTPTILAYAPVVAQSFPGPDLLIDGRRVYLTCGDDEDNSAVGLTILDVGIPGDADGDWDVDLADFAALQRCYGVAGGGNPGATSGLTASCLFADFDQDDDVDAADFALFADVFTGVDPPTTDPTGACCLPDGTCRDAVTEPDCTWRLGGIYQGDGVTCDNVTCPPTGACCLPYGSIACEQYTEDACTRHGGTWYGEGTDCSQGWCPFGACCNPTDGSCSELRPDACEASGGVYMGDGTDCATTQCQFAFYENTITPMTSMALAGAGLQIADDLTLDGDPAARDLTYLDLRVYGNGGGTFDVTVSLYTDCPGNGGTLIPGTTFDWTVPDDGYVYELAADPIDPPVTIPDTVWMVVTFSTPESGWIIAEQAEVGYTENWYGWLNPWDCNHTLTGHHAGLWANLRCIAGGRKSDGGDGGHNETRLHTIKLDTPVDAASDQGP